MQLLEISIFAVIYIGVGWACRITTCDVITSRLWQAITFNDPESPAHFALWFLHAVSLPFPGKHKWYKI